MCRLIEISKQKAGGYSDVKEEAILLEENWFYGTIHVCVRHSSLLKKSLYCTAVTSGM